MCIFLSQFGLLAETKNGLRMPRELLDKLGEADGEVCASLFLLLPPLPDLQSVVEG